jgi:metallophosphoesterase (TIGR00282 family)
MIIFLFHFTAIMSTISIFFIGDIIGKPGLDFLQVWLPGILQKYKPDVVLANGENVSDGKGITAKEADALVALGVHVITGGNHTWDKHQSQEYIQKKENVLRPFNYPKGTHGNGMYVHQSKLGKVAVLNLQGRAFMATIDCPFRGAEFALSRIVKDTSIIIVDFHAEATAEKIALASFLDGKVTAVIGTHTHVQTSDERILPNGTAFISDVGMTGPYESVIGMKTQAAINRFLYQTPQKYETAQNDVHLCAVNIKADMTTGKAISIERIFFPDFNKTYQPV